MRSTSRRAVVVVALAALSAGCTAEESEVSGRPTATSGNEGTADIESRDVAFLEALDSAGYVYLLLGHDTMLTNLYEYNLATEELRPLTTSKSQFGISAFGAGPAGLTVADASDGGIDVSRVFRGGELTDLPPRDGSTDGFSPLVNARGDILRATPHRDVEAVSIDVLLHGTNRWRELYRGTAPSTGVWVGDATIAFTTVTYGPGKNKLVTMNARNGQVVGERVLPGYAVVLPNSYPDRQPLTIWAIGKRPSGFVETNGRIVHLAAGWTPKCWDPEGSQLLVKHRGTVGIVDREAPAKVHVLGKVSLVWNDCAWLSEPPPGIPAE